MLDLITGAVADRSARGVAAVVSRLVTSGALPAGARLPTVRDVARDLGISPTTVSEAWRSLAKAGAIQTRGRSSTFVLAPIMPRQRLRYFHLTDARDIADGGDHPALHQDLSTGPQAVAAIPLQGRAGLHIDGKPGNQRQQPWEAICAS